MIRQKFNYTSTDGSEPVEFHEWAKESLTSAEYNKWQAAVSRQSAIREQHIKQGHLIIDPKTKDYIWDNEWIKDKDQNDYKEYDLEWLAFWERYLSETGIKFTITEEENQ